MNSASADPLLATVVLNWNRREDTLACLASLQASKWPRRTEIVVDNASDEDVVGAVTARHPDAVIVRNRINLGFAGGMNAGLRKALELGADYILLLNNDTLIDPAMPETLVRAAVARPDAGILTPLVLYRDAPAMVASAGWEFDPRRGHPGRPLHAGERAEDRLHGVREVDASSGEAMLVAATAVREVGTLEEALYLRLEDIDWSLRMRSAGRRNYTVLDARLWHGVSQSSGGEHSELNAYYHTRNILFVCARHAPMSRPRATLRDVETLLANLVHARRGTRPAANARAVLAGWRDYARGRMGARAA